MTNKIVRIMQYNGSGNDTLIPLTAQQADNATNATNAETAVIGQYASSDTSKGTIEQRLTNLEGSYLSGQANITAFTPATASPYSYTNALYRQGNLCVFDLDVQGVTNTSPFVFSKGVEAIIGTIPEGFRPDSSRLVGYAEIYSLGTTSTYMNLCYVKIYSNGNLAITLSDASNTQNSVTFVSGQVGELIFHVGYKISE